MKNLGRAVTIMGVLAGISSMSAALMVGCSGDDNKLDSGPDVVNDNTTPDVKTDSPPPDAGEGGTDADADVGNPVLQFRVDLAKAFCNRFQTCCNGLDAGLGTFDFNKCVQLATASAYNGSNSQLNSVEVQNRNLVTLESDRVRVVSRRDGDAVLSGRDELRGHDRDIQLLRRHDRNAERRTGLPRFDRVQVWQLLQVRGRGRWQVRSWDAARSVRCARCARSAVWSGSALRQPELHERRVRVQGLATAAAFLRLRQLPRRGWLHVPAAACEHDAVLQR